MFFKELKINDKLYMVRKESMDILELTVTSLILEIDKIKIHFAQPGYIFRERSFLINGNSWTHEMKDEAGNIYYIFTFKSDAITYAKAQLISVLNAKIDYAKAAINQLLKFRLENYDQLNQDWIQSEIDKLTALERRL